MKEDIYKKLIDDGIVKGILIETCLGCGAPTTEKGAAADGIPYKDCGCPAGTGIRWSRRALDSLVGRVAVEYDTIEDVTLEHCGYLLYKISHEMCKLHIIMDEEMLNLCDRSAEMVELAKVLGQVCEKHRLAISKCQCSGSSMSVSRLSNGQLMLEAIMIRLM